MPVESVFSIIKIDGRALNPPISRAYEKVIDEYVWNDFVLASASSATIDFGGVSTALSVYAQMATSGSVSLAGQVVHLVSGGFILAHLTSMNALSVSNHASVSNVAVRVGIFGS